MISQDGFKAITTFDDLQTYFNHPNDMTAVLMNNINTPPNTFAYIKDACVATLDLNGNALIGADEQSVIHIIDGCLILKDSKGTRGTDKVIHKTGKVIHKRGAIGYGIFMRGSPRNEFIMLGGSIEDNSLGGLCCIEGKVRIIGGSIKDMPVPNDRIDLEITETRKRIFCYCP